MKWNKMKLKLSFELTTAIIFRIMHLFLLTFLDSCGNVLARVAETIADQDGTTETRNFAVISRTWLRTQAVVIQRHSWWSGCYSCCWLSTPTDQRKRHHCQHNL